MKQKLLGKLIILLIYIYFHGLACKNRYSSSDLCELPVWDYTAQAFLLTFEVNRIHIQLYLQWC